ncbi:hypothetical protein V493_07722, partial [Pseudogymnoascus sp. VKM F-4281 (FW-2241)]
PRHHPAVNNNHPDLTEIRTSVRQLSKFTDVEATKASFLTADEQARHTASTAATQRRQALRATIARDIEAGSMTYADAAKAEADSAAAENEHTKATSKASFERFQTAVVAPVNDLLMERVHTATTLFTQLRGQLFDDARAQDPTATQEEGDEQPELLEKLTLLKWIFEAREQLHAELYDLLSDRNDRVRAGGAGADDGVYGCRGGECSEGGGGAAQCLLGHCSWASEHPRQDPRDRDAGVPSADPGGRPARARGAEHVPVHREPDEPAVSAARGQDGCYGGAGAGAGERARCRGGGGGGGACAGCGGE